MRAAAFDTDTDCGPAGDEGGVRPLASTGGWLVYRRARELFERRTRLVPREQLHPPFPAGSMVGAPGIEPGTSRV
jgi:hypothetical protein